MATLNILVEAAKLVEYDKDTYANRKKSLTLPGNERSIGPSTCTKSGLRRGTRETHNILEKNRRADMKNYFQKLKCNLPKLRDMVKASNVSILTDAVRHIQELTAADREYQIEMARLRKCQSELEARIKVLKEDIRKQHFPTQFAQMQKETPSQGTASHKKMMSVEIQANENDIKAELPPPDERETNHIQSNNRNYLTDLSNDLTQNVQSSAERLSFIMSSKLSPLTANLREMKNSSKLVQPLERLNYYGSEKVALEKETCHLSKEHKQKNRRKRKLVAENDETDSDNDLRIILDDD